MKRLGIMRHEMTVLYNVRMTTCRWHVYTVIFRGTKNFSLNIYFPQHIFQHKVRLTSSPMRSLLTWPNYDKSFVKGSTSLIVGKSKKKNYVWRHKNAKKQHFSPWQINNTSRILRVHRTCIFVKPCVPVIFTPSSSSSFRIHFTIDLHST